MNIRAAAFAASVSGLAIMAATPAPVHAAPNPWGALLEADIAAMYRILRDDHPGAVDPINKGFARWLEAGRRQALDRARRCTSYEGYRFALEAYAAGFHDVHLGAEAELRRESVRWPGFATAWQPAPAGGVGAGKLVVRVVGDGKDGEGAPPLGSEVVSCDGKPAREILEREIFPFSHGNPALEGGWSWLAPMLLVDERNPWRPALPGSCKIADGNTTRDHKLGWREIDLSALRAYRERIHDRPKLDFVARPFGARGIWVSMPGFSPSKPTTVAGMKALIAQAGAWRDRDPIVLDVRNNGGGSSDWGDLLLEALYGKDLYRSIIEPLFANQYVEWRVSKANLEHVRTFVPIVERMNGAGSAAVEDMRALVAGFERALTEGKSLWRYQSRITDAPPPSATKPGPSPVSGRIFLITDERCASACLDFADRVRALPGAQHVGRTTAADSVYMEVRPFTLPSGIARGVVATKVYRNRPRGNNEPYVPHHRWSGSMADTPGLERWLLTLGRGK